MIVKFLDFISENKIWMNKGAEFILPGGKEKVKEEITDILQDVMDDFGIDCIDITSHLESTHADYDINIYYSVMNTRAMNDTKFKREMFKKMIDLYHTLKNEGYVDQIEGRLEDIGLKLLKTKFVKLSREDDFGLISFQVMKMKSKG